jgi:hypothetical protein
MKYFLAVLMALFMASTAYAWTPEQCKVVLSYGIYDDFNIVEFQHQFKQVKSNYCENSSNSTSSIVSIPSIVDFKGSQNSQSNLCSSLDETVLNTYYYQYAKHTINRQVIDAFSQCVKEQPPGLTYYIMTTPDPKKVFVEFDFKAYAGTYIEDTLTFNIEGAECTSADFDGKTVPQQNKQLKIKGTGIELACTRNANDSIIVLARVAKGDRNTQKVILPPYKEPTSPAKSWTFLGPQVKGVALDQCSSYEHSCTGDNGVDGQVAADRWCHQYGFGDATKLTLAKDSPPTRTISGEQDCSYATCDRVETVTCGFIGLQRVVFPE